MDNKDVGNWLSRYKWYIIGATAGVALLVWLTDTFGTAGM